MKRIILPLMAGSLGVCFGLLVGGKGAIGAIATGGVFAGVSGVVTGIVKDSKRQSELNNNLDKLNAVEKALKKAENRAAVAEESLPAVLQEVQNLKKSLVQANQIVNSVKPISEETKVLLQSLNVENTELKGTIEALEKELEGWISDYAARVELEVSSRVESEVQRIRVEELEKIFGQHDDLYKRARDISERYKKWGKAVGEKHNLNTQLLSGLSQGCLEQITELTQDNARITELKDREIELLKRQQVVLQLESQGIITEPGLIDAGFNDDLKLGNFLCTTLFREFKVALRFYAGYTSEEGLLHLGFMTSKGADRFAIASQLNGVAKQVKELLGVYSVESVNASKVLEGIEFVIRRSRPIALKEEQVYRIMTPATGCFAALRDALDHNKGGRPTMRVMGSTGQGKGIVVKSFVADWVRSEPGEVWFSDPMDGSSQDYWEMPKAAKSSKEGSALLATLTKEFQLRRDKQSERKEVPVLAVFDEFDKEHPDEDKEKIKKIWTAIRHHKIKMILLGQSGEVGDSGWKWDEMGNCAMLFVGSSIGTGLKHHEDLGISREDKKSLTKKHDEIKLYLEDKNHGLSSDVMYRAALLVIDGKGKFLELPPALKGEVKSDRATIVSTPWESLNEVKAPTVSETRICPGCGGKLRKSGNRLRCENQAHTKEMGVKSFSKNP